MDETSQTLADCQAVLGHRFANLELLRAALTHASVANHRLASNERLEFLGDAVLGIVVCEELYRRFPELLEGDMTKIKSIVVSRKTCAAMSRTLGLDRLMFLGKGMPSGRELPGSLAAAVFESITAALYLDAGFEKTRAWILEQIGPQIDMVVADTHAKNFKSILQHYAQRELGASPSYHLLDEKGPDHSKCFEIGVTIGSQRFPSGWGSSKKEAEQRAALSALIDLGIADRPEIAATVAEYRRSDRTRSRDDLSSSSGEVDVPSFRRRSSSLSDSLDEYDGPDLESRVD